MFNRVDYKLIGNRLQKMRKSRGYTQEQLAEALEYSSGYVSQIERGLTRPNIDTIAYICNFLECDMADILTEANDNKQYLSKDINELYNQLDHRERRLLYEMLKTYIENRKK